VSLLRAFAQDGQRRGVQRRVSTETRVLEVKRGWGLRNHVVRHEMATSCGGRPRARARRNDRCDWTIAINNELAVRPVGLAATEDNNTALSMLAMADHMSDRHDGHVRQLSYPGCTLCRHRLSARYRVSPEYASSFRTTINCLPGSS
jgi:hypothetical protein